MPKEDEILTQLIQIQIALQRLQGDMDKVKRAVMSEAEFEEEQLELEKEMGDLAKPDPELVNEVRYKEETLDEVEKELGS